MENIYMVNPFADEPLPKAFYYPTRKQELNDDQKRTTLEPDRLMYSGDIITEKEQALLDSHFLKSTHTYNSRLLTTKDAAPADTSAKFDESWPTSEKPSISIPELDLPVGNFESKYRERKANADSSNKHDTFMTPERDTSARTMVKGPTAKTTDSTLAKYIDRFRHGTPMSREERERVRQQQEKADFWWISDQSKISEPSDTSTPIDKNGVRTRRRTPRDSRPETTVDDGNSTGATLTLNEFMKQEREREKAVRRRGPGTHGKLDDSVCVLQEKADRLLEKNSSSMNSSGPMVSTQGLGSTVSSITPRSVQEVPYRPEFTRKTAEATLPPDVVKGGDDDILVQWRRRRKVEEMKARAEMGEPISKTATLMPKNKDLDWKVQAFRQKLQDALASTEPAGTASCNTQHDRVRGTTSATSVTFTPAPCKATTTTQAEIAVQTSLEDTSSVPRKVPAHSHSPIASPHLPHSARDSTRLTNDVEPHMHLSCDIIPCPHQIHKTLNSQGSQESNTTLRKHVPSKKSVVEKERKYSKRQSQPVNQGVDMENEQNDSSVLAPPTLHYGVSDVSFEQLKAKHMRSLQKEENLRLDLSLSTDEETLPKKESSRSNRNRQTTSNPKQKSHDRDYRSFEGGENDTVGDRYDRSTGKDNSKSQRRPASNIDKGHSQRDRSKAFSSGSNMNGQTSKTSRTNEAKHSPSTTKSSSARESKYSRSKNSDIEAEQCHVHTSESNLEEYNTRVLRPNSHTNKDPPLRGRREHRSSKTAHKQRPSSNHEGAKESEFSYNGSGDAVSNSSLNAAIASSHSKDRRSNKHDHFDSHDENDRCREPEKDDARKFEREDSLKFSKMKSLTTDDSVRISVDSLTDVSVLDPNITNSFMQRQPKMTVLSQQMSEERVSEVSDEEKSGSNRDSNEKQPYFADNSDFDSSSPPQKYAGKGNNVDYARSKQRPVKPKSSSTSGRGKKGSSIGVLHPTRGGSEREEGPTKSKAVSRKTQDQPSPMHSLGSTIANVVGNRLFTTSMSIVTSSLEDSFQATPTPLELANGAKRIEATPSHSELCNGAPIQAQLVDTVNQSHTENENTGELDLEEALVSDGEEYEQDEILRDLRARRLYHIHRLKCIDKLLAQGPGS